MNQLPRPNHVCLAFIPAVSPELHSEDAGVSNEHTPDNFSLVPRIIPEGSGKWQCRPRHVDDILDSFPFV